MITEKIKSILLIGVVVLLMSVLGVTVIQRSLITSLRSENIALKTVVDDNIAAIEELKSESKKNDKAVTKLIKKMQTMKDSEIKTLKDLHGVKDEVSKNYLSTPVPEPVVQLLREAASQNGTRKAGSTEELN